MASTRRKPCRVLLVEDDTDHRDLILSKISRVPWFPVKVQWEALASKGISILKSERFDIVLLDLSLPDSRPEETLQAFADEFPTMPIVVLTSLADEELIENAISWGAQDFLDKSTVTSELMARSLRYAIKRKESLNHLRKQNEALRTFSHTVAHELRSPLQSVVTALHLIRESALPAGDNNTLSRLVELGIDSTTHLTNLVNELLAFAKYDGENFAKEPVELSPLVEDVIREVRAFHVMDDAEVIVEGEMPVVKGAALQLRQVLLNLVSNAFKYRDERPLKVTILAKLQKNGWLISIKDNGVGISEADLPKISNLFYRVSRDTEIPGTGIGLSFSKQIIERHGGYLDVESQLDEGSNFSFFLPG
ncbi:MAG: HAMP domain-containing sensor histidine kinase [Verrucomicrobiales bacterium]|nr:HAMP domain-containing sensor histidine kinase [Verrucomicrobiales bacterium]